MSAILHKTARLFRNASYYEFAPDTRLSWSPASRRKRISRIPPRSGNVRISPVNPRYRSPPTARLSVHSVKNNSDCRTYGGGYSPSRTPLPAKFPAIREIYREFFIFMALSRPFSILTHCRFGAFFEISQESEQGIKSAYQGIIFPDQAINRENEPIICGGAREP
jgi:hypothetical protein